MLACAGDGPRLRTPPSAVRILSVSLVDSLPFTTELTDGVHRRVLVRTTRGADTLPGVRVLVPPVVVGDTALHGVAASENGAEGLYAYSARTRRVRRLPALPDWFAFASPELAPDGRHLAYLAVDGQGRGYAAVASIPDGRVVYRGPKVDMLETDAGVDSIGWIGPTRFVVRIDLSVATGGTQRTRGTLAPMRVEVDTVRPAVR